MLLHVAATVPALTGQDPAAPSKDTDRT